MTRKQAEAHGENRILYQLAMAIRHCSHGSPLDDIGQCLFCEHFGPKATGLRLEDGHSDDCLYLRAQAVYVQKHGGPGPVGITHTSKGRYYDDEPHDSPRAIISPEVQRP